jgi:YegS/Rv2252/BmrU family lipid kinase
MKLAIIVNPIAGGGRSYGAIQRYVAQWPHSPWQVTLLTTRVDYRAGLLARELLDQPPDLLAVCGGDGTINEVASQIPHSPFPVAVLPAGTANVVARELGLPLDPIRALQIALKRNVRRVDLGKLGGESGRRFLFVAGIGFDADVVAKVPPKLKKRLGKAAFAITAIRSLRNYAFPEFRVDVGSKTFSATSCLVCNARSYGGGMLFCPNADMTDGLLDILILQGKRRVEWAGFLLQALRGKAVEHDWIHRIQAKELKIAGSSEVMVQTDGELAGHLPLDLGIDDRAFPLVVP